MGLIGHVLRFLVNAILRFGALLAVLFCAHLLISRLVPHVQRTARLIDERPLIEQRVQTALRDQQLREKRLASLQSQLRAESAARLDALRGEASYLENQAKALSRDRARTLQELTDARALVQEYCDTYNPIKWWYCNDIRARSDALERQLEATVARVEGELTRVREKASVLQQQLERAAKDPDAQLQLLEDHAPHETARLLADIERARQAAADAKRTVTDARRRQEAARNARASLAGWLVSEWRTSWPRLVGVALAVLLLPWLQRVLWFYGLMPLVDRVAPIRLTENAEDAKLTPHEACRSLRIALRPGEVLSVRQAYARPLEGQARSRLLYRLRAPFISYAAGLVMMTRLLARADGATSAATLAAPEDPDSYLMRIDLQNHPGIVIRPRQLVGLIGDLHLRTAWRPFSVHAWSTWQLRYILLGGTGSIIVEGMGDIVAERLTESRAKIEQKLVVGFDGRLAYRTSRTETFLPYFFGRAPLVDDVFEGNGTYLWQKSSQRKGATAAERTFDALFGALGKLLGF